MRSKADLGEVVAEIDFRGMAEGAILDPMEESSRNTFPGWETPLAPWGGFNLSSELVVVDDGGSKAIEWVGPERALVAGNLSWRDCRAVAQIRPLEAEAHPNNDRNDWRESLVGIIFRVETSRFYYHFGIEGLRRAVLYRRRDDEWTPLAMQDIVVPDSYLTLEVLLDGDGIRCRCREIGVDLFVTDNGFRAGKVGVRAISRSRCSAIAISMTPSQMRESVRRARAQRSEQLALGAEIRDATPVREFDLKALGGYPQFTDVAKGGRYDLLISGSGTRLQTVEGELIWEIDEGLTGIVPMSELEGRGRHLFGFSGARTSTERLTVVGGTLANIFPDEMVVLRGDTGEVLVRRDLPEMDKDVYRPQFTTHTGRLTGTRSTDIILREWSDKYGGGGVNLWAYSAELEPLWHHRVDTPYGHAHALQFVDVDGDGRDEVLAGGTLLSHQGEVLWVHDRVEEMSRIRGAHHYDAVLAGDLSADSALDPGAFLLGGSAGVYVVDGITGETRMVHRVGHAQGRYSGKVRQDLPGTEVLVACRWGNMGILTLFSGSGERLWSIQPDYLGQGSCPVNWAEDGAALIWANTSAEVQGFYDGYGRRVKDLEALREAYGGRMRRDASASVVKMGTSRQEYLSLRTPEKLSIFGPSK